MRDLLPAAVEKAISELSKLPGVGEKTALRYAMNLLGRGRSAPLELAQALQDMTREVRPCRECRFLAQDDLCGLCSDPARDQHTLCVVESVADVLAIERTAEYRGLYHVLGGVISVLRGVTPEDLGIDRLLDRVARLGVSEVIVATGASAEGETTALYIRNALEDRGVKVTRPATGIPMGTQLEFLDALTLLKAFSARKEL